MRRLGRDAMATGTVMPTVVRAIDATSLRERFRGQLLGYEDDSYEGARKVWNAMIDRHPLLIARCVGAADVIAAITFARERDLRVSVRGGGHGVSGKAVCDDGLMIDLSLMKSIR